MKDGDATFDECACTGAWYCFGIEDLNWVDPAFENFCKSRLAEEYLDLDDEDMDLAEEVLNLGHFSGHEIVDIVDDLPWVKIKSFSGDGAGIIFFFVDPENRAALQRIRQNDR